MNAAINKKLMRFSRRAEKVDEKTLVASFVEIGPLQHLLTSPDNQIIYGRRGTGKTHALIYFGETMKAKSDLSVYVDMRLIGSTGGIYSDFRLPFSERATRLLLDALAALHDGIYSAVLDDKYDLNLAIIGPILDKIANAITEITVQGPVESETIGEQSQKTIESEEAGLSVGSDAGLKLGLTSSQSTERESRGRHRLAQHGELRHRVHFGRLGSALNELSDAINGKRLWFLIDEWSAVPLDLQPYLADLLRRSVFPITKISTKIGAIENRSRFQLAIESGDYIGIELGADASVDANMDDFMVFDNDEEQASSFFLNLIYKHYLAMLEDDDDLDKPKSMYELRNWIFTRTDVFSEFVRASEGIPRDAFNILSGAALNAKENKISMDLIRKASQANYLRDKEAAVSANQDAQELLHWIIDEVIAHRRARAFLLPREPSDSLIDTLFDERVLHLLKKNVSDRDQPGKRYDVYKIDYGCYVDLLATSRTPLGLLNLDEGGHIEVPPDDYRAIRRAILNIEEFRNRIDQRELF